MTVFYIAPEHHEAAQVLANREAPRTSPHSLEDTSKLTVTGGDITVYAHSATYTDKKDEVAVGGMTPQQLADTLAKKIKNKKDVKDVYLLSCEAGLALGGSTYAQKLIEALKNKGFNHKDLKVHAVEGPQGAYAMRVNVTSNPGLAGRRLGINAGHVKGVYYGNEYSALLDEAISLADAAGDQKAKQSYEDEKERAESDGRYQQYPFFSSPNYKEDLREQKGYCYQQGVKIGSNSEAHVAMASFVFEQQEKLSKSFQGKDTEIHIKPFQDFLAKEFDPSQYEDARKAEAAKFLIESLTELLVGMEQDKHKHKHLEKTKEFVDRLKDDLTVVQTNDTLKNMANDLALNRMQPFIKKFPKMSVEEKFKKACKTSTSTYFQSIIRPFFEERNAIDTKAKGSKQDGKVSLNRRITTLKQEIERLRPRAQAGAAAKAKREENYQAIRDKYHPESPSPGITGGGGSYALTTADSRVGQFKSSEALNAFQDYNTARKAGYIRNTILNIITATLFGRIQACIFPHKTQEAKVTASGKIMTVLQRLQNGQEGNETLTDDEKKALQDGRLGKLVEKHLNALPRFIQDQIQPVNEKTPLNPGMHL